MTATKTSASGNNLHFRGATGFLFSSLQECTAAETRLLKLSVLDASPGSEALIPWQLLGSALVLVAERADTNSSLGLRAEHLLLASLKRNWDLWMMGK